METNGLDVQAIHPRNGRPLVKPAKRHSFVMDSIARVFAMVKDREK